MAKRNQFIMLSFLLIGYVFFGIINIFRDSMSPFALGFFEGISLVFIIAGIGYLVWYIIKNKK